MKKAKNVIVPLGCKFCQISFNIAQKYKVLKCNKSPNFNKTHNFVDLRIVAQ